MRLLLISLLVIASLMGWWLHSRQPPVATEHFSVGEALGGISAEGFERAIEPRSFHFPQDHGAHPGFRNEWWYFTGNLHSTEGRRFGFQLVFFRNALAPVEAKGESPWRSQHIWMAHFALTDAETGEFHAFERFNREAVGLAGVETAPFALWLDDWSIKEQDDHWLLQAAKAGVSLNLKLQPQSTPLLQGDGGLSQKSAEVGNASYYYSIPRLQAEGQVSLNGRQHQVSGLSWLDREWSTSALSKQQVGWDWFSLQLDDGSDLMYYRLRHNDGSTDLYSAGSWRQPDGSLIRLTADDVQLEIIEQWRSPKGGRYPLRWRLQIPSKSLDLQITPVINNQELDLLIRYWEGAMDVVGIRDDKPVQGEGYLELTGYAEK
jgi:predicted secreted hydrolase